MPAALSPPPSTDPTYRLWVLTPGHLARDERGVWICVAAGLSAAEATRFTDAATAETRIDGDDPIEEAACPA